MKSHTEGQCDGCICVSARRGDGAHCSVPTCVGVAVNILYTWLASAEFKERREPLTLCEPQNQLKALRAETEVS